MRLPDLAHCSSRARAAKITSVQEPKVQIQAGSASVSQRQTDFRATDTIKPTQTRQILKNVTLVYTRGV